jgi:hypothetical protein
MESQGSAGHHTVKDREYTCVFVYLFWSLPLIKLPGFHHGGFILMTLSHPNPLLKAPPPNTIVRCKVDPYQGREHRMVEWVSIF